MEVAFHDDLSAIGVRNGQFAVLFLKRIIRDDNLMRPITPFADDAEHGLLRTLQIIVGQLLVEVVIDDCVGELRPAVHDVPPQDTRLPPLVDADVLHEELLGLRLHDLAGQAEILRIVRIKHEFLSYLLEHEWDAIVITKRRMMEPLFVFRRVPVAFLLPRPDIVRAEEFLHGGDGIRTVVAAFADERRVVVRIERTLKVVARPPDVLFGRGFPRKMLRFRFGRIVR